MKDTTKTILLIVGLLALLITSIVLFFVDHKDVKDITIMDKTGDECADTILYFYEDDDYQYYFKCAKVIFVQVDDEIYEISDALNEDKVTIDELVEAGLSFYKTKIES
ncbi:MAG TPA: hypothetical protein PLX66_03070 [Bacilli bacterium]|nr:hypothetical protein [Bacilli bacterium]